MPEFVSCRRTHVEQTTAMSGRRGLHFKIFEKKANNEQNRSTKSKLATHKYLTESIRNKVSASLPCIIKRFPYWWAMVTIPPIDSSSFISVYTCHDMGRQIVAMFFKRKSGHIRTLIVTEIIYQLITPAHLLWHAKARTESMEAMWSSRNISNQGWDDIRWR